MQVKSMSAVRVTAPFMNKYERARLLGLRAQDLDRGAPPIIKLDDSWDTAIRIAEEELRQGLIPMVIVRELPDGTEERWHVTDFVNYKADLDSVVDDDGDGNGNGNGDTSS